MGNANIGLHSLRSGGATAAANSNVNERCWKKDGRWASDPSKDGYVKDSVESRLSFFEKIEPIITNKRQSGYMICFIFFSVLKIFRIVFHTLLTFENLIQSSSGSHLVCDVVNLLEIFFLVIIIL